MSKVSLFLFALLVAALGAPATEDVSDYWRIVGGTDADPTPYQASLRYSDNNNHFCGGTVINARTIVTAAHCVLRKSESSMIVVVGTTTLDSGGTTYTVSKIIPHPDYDGRELINDVAVVITSSPIVEDANIAYIPLSNSTVEAGVSVKLTGWGSLSVDGEVPNNLQTITLSTLSFSDCQSRWSHEGTIYESHLCTFTKVGEGACYGDSGSPLVANDQLVGIVSWGYPCAVGFPDVHSRVSSFVDWINENAQN